MARPPACVDYQGSGHVHGHAVRGCLPHFATMPLPLMREMVLQHAGHQTRVLEMPPLEAQGVVVFSKTLAWVIELCNGTGLEAKNCTMKHPVLAIR